LRTRVRGLAARVTGREAASHRRRITDLEAALASAVTGAEADRPPEPAVVYSALSPAPRNALGLFPGAWSTRVPGGEGPGTVELFDDERIAWMIDRLGGVDGLEVLELGPLEGAHTCMLEQAGATVEAIEANHDAFLRCLIVKNLFGLSARFTLGDFSVSFGDRQRFDLIVASGVLYHMTEPTRLLERMAAASDKVMLWTHYFEPDVSKWHPYVAALVGTKWRPEAEVRWEVAGVTVRAVPQLYDDALEWSGFCGGPETHSLWLRRQDILEVLAALGFTRVEVAFDTPDHVFGPAFCVLAQR
jgi:hypothetical protein